MTYNNNQSSASQIQPGQRSRYSDWLWVGRPRGRSLSPGRVKNFLLHVVQTGSGGPTQPPIQCVQLTTQLELVPSSRKCESVHLLTHTPSWRSA
jgi:hypothetical protein